MHSWYALRAKKMACIAKETLEIATSIFDDDPADVPLALDKQAIGTQPAQQGAAVWRPRAAD